MLDEQAEDLEKPIAVIFQAEYDPVGLLDNPVIDFEIHELIKTHFVVYRIINDPLFISKTLKEVYETRKKPIDAFIIRGHGISDIIELDQNKICLSLFVCLSADELITIVNENRYAVESATIILEACLIAKMAEVVHQATKLRVFGSRVAVNCWNTNFCFCALHKKIEMSSSVELYQPDEFCCPFQEEISDRRTAYIQEQAKLGDAKAQFYFATWCKIKGEYKLAHQWYLLAAKQSYADAKYALGRLQEDVFKSSIDAEKWYAAAAQQGHVGAHYALGQLYEKFGKLYDSKKCYTAAARLGHAGAQIALGKLCLNEYGDIGEAAYWFIKAYEQSHADVITQLTELIPLLRESDSPSAQYSLGRCYHKGLVVEKDEISAMELYTKAAHQGHAESHTALAKGFLRKGLFDEAVKLFISADELGDAEAQVILGTASHKGIVGVKQSDEDAARWLLKAAEQTHPEAIRLLTEYATSGSASHQYALGQCYHRGIGIAPDDQLAINWYTQAAKQGHKDAQKDLAELLACLADRTAHTSEEDVDDFLRRPLSPPPEFKFF